MTLQEAFDKIWAHAQLKQPARMTSDAGTPCYYRHPDYPTKRCFIGCLIPDELYNRDWDIPGTEACASGLYNVLITIENGSLVGDIHALRELQKIHDNYHPDNWNDKLREYAIEYGLVVPE